MKDCPGRRRMGGKMSRCNACVIVCRNTWDQQMTKAPGFPARRPGIGFGIGFRGCVRSRGGGLRFIGLRIFFCRGLILIGAIIGFIKAAAAENNSDTGGNQPLNRQLAAFRAFFNGLGGDGLKFLKRMTTFFTSVFISWHTNNSTRRG